jgi:4-amino-4-deoxy-L-arabinose transferase-like glycosyltransferase
VIVVRHRFWVHASIWILAACLGTWATWQALAPRGVDPVRLEMHAPWLASEQQVAQFRKELMVPSHVKNAWIAVTAHEGYEVVVNGVSAGQSLLWRPTRDFQTGLSERGQRVLQSKPMLDLTFPREYQWEGHRSERLPAFFDIAPFLTVGKNALCVEVEVRSAPALFSLEGEIVLWSGEVIPLQSDESFRAAPTPPVDRLWTQASSSDLDWPAATRAQAPDEPLLVTLDPAVYRKPFAGEWLRAARQGDGAVWFETTWSLPGAPRDAWLRVVTNGTFEVFVNDQGVEVADTRPEELDTGDWLVGPRTSMDSPAAAESLDPREIGSLFVGPRLGPSPSVTTESAPVPVPTGFAAEPTLQGTPLLRGTAVDQPPGAEPAPSAGPDLGQPLGPSRSVVAPRDLSRERRTFALYAYGVRHLLQAGDNRVAVRLSAPEQDIPRTWAPKLAVDGSASVDGVVGSVRLSSGSSQPWIARAQDSRGAPAPPVEALASGPASAAGTPLPRLAYRGVAAMSPSRWLESVSASAALTLLALLALSRLPEALRRLRARWLGSGAGAPPPPSAAGRAWVLVPPAALIGAAALVSWSWGERDEMLALLSPSAWRLLLGVAVVLGAATAAALASGRSAGPSPEAGARWMSRHRLWPVLVGLVLAAAFILRVHRMDAQPLDDDELASTQAVLSIARTGLPRFTPDVFYTRGPLYHYLTAAFVRVLGGDVWALRLPSVLFGVGTTWLVYRAGERLLGSRWTGLVSAALYGIHPYAIFVGHLVRFYQQQSFFALATVIAFCEGFVGGPRASARYLALGAFCAACFSQELTVVLIPPLLLAYLLCGRRLDRRAALSFSLVAAGAALLVVVNLLVFQTRCLTKLEGISPNVEATLAFHFSSPSNFLALFIGHSRLHLALSLLLLASLPLLVRETSANVLALLVVLLVGVASTNLLVTGQSLRYQYWLFPVWLLLGVHGVRALARTAAARSVSALGRWLGGGWMAPLVGTLAVGAVVLAWSPWRIPGSYSAPLLGDSASAFGYVRSHMRPGDEVAASEPHTHAGLLETGRIDYDLAVPLLYDFVYRKDGRLVDRSGGATVVSSVEELEEVVARTDRLWVLVNREKLRSRGQEIRWELPAARVEQFLRRNLEVKYQSYLWTVFLWDAQAGRFHSLAETSIVPWHGGQAPGGAAPVPLLKAPGR